MLTSTPAPTATARYLAPGWFTRQVFNRLVARLTKVGLSLAGSRVLTVAGRTSGRPRSTVVNVLRLDGEQFLVAPRGQAQWVRNLRVAGTATLRVGRRVESVVATELDDDAKLPVLRAYLERWRWEVGQFFDDLDHRSSDDQLRAAAPGFPAFRLELAQN